MPRFLDLEQGAPDWLEWREGGLGASDVPIVMEESPWQTAYQLWSQKCGFTPKKPSTPAMEHGKASEEVARQWYVANRGIEVMPAVAVYDDAEYIRASVDGWNAERRHGVEIKCPVSIENHRKAKEGEIPSFYMLQMIAEMETLDAASWDYCSWFEGDGVIIPVERNTDLWLVEILPRLQEFWRRVEEKSWPRPEGAAVDESPEWAMAAETVIGSKRSIRLFEDQKRRGEAALRMRATAKTTTGGGIKAVWYNVKPRWDINIKITDPAMLDKVMAALEPLSGKKGVGEIKPRAWPANLWLKVMEEGEKESDDG